MHTCDAEKRPLPSSLLLDVHGRLAKAANINDPEREVAKPWPDSESQSRCLPSISAQTCDTYNDSLLAPQMAIEVSLHVALRATWNSSMGLPAPI